MLVLGPGSSLSQIIQVYETGWQSKLTMNYFLLPEISDIKYESMNSFFLFYPWRSNMLEAL